MKNKLLIPILILVLTFTACSTSNNKTSEQESSTAITQNTVSENGKEETSDASETPIVYYLRDEVLTKVDGSTTTIGEFEGDTPILLNFWASWCHFCVEEMSFLNQLHKDGKAIVIAINVGESDETINKFVSDNGLEFNVFKDGDSLFGTFGGRGLPLNAFLGSDTELFYVHPGLIDEQIYSEIRTAIEEFIQDREKKAE